MYFSRKHFGTLVALGSILAPAWLGAEEPASLRPGLLGRFYRGENFRDPARAVRIDERIAFDWGDAPPDLRLEPGPFSVVWRGQLFVPDDGAYRFRLDTDGEARVLLDGELLLAASGRAAARHWSEPHALRYGYRPLEVRFRTTGPRARIALHWMSEHFAPEPLSGANLFLEEADELAARSAASFRRGRLLATRLRCAACHPLPGLASPRAAPALTRHGGGPRAAAIADRLRDRAGARSLPAHSTMPVFSLAEDQVQAVAAYLAPGAPPRGRPADAPRPGDVTRGRELTLRRGCLACHSLEGLGGNGEAGAETLERASGRRTREALIRWLEPPETGRPASAHRPRLPLDAGERRQIAAYLESLGEPSGQPNAPATGRERRDHAVRRGRAVVQQRNCGACHELPDRFSVALAPPLDRDAPLSWERSCLSPPPPGSLRPFYPLEPEARRHLKHFISHLAAGARSSAFDRGAALLEERGCLSCHPRDASPGLGPLARQLAERHPSLRGRAAALRAPSLQPVGDKLREKALLDALRGDAPPRRRWLEVRMPRFHHRPGEIEALALYLTTRDRAPPPPASADPRPTPPGERLFEAGHRLVGPRGFSCTSCHDIGEYRPRGVELSALGPDLLSPGKRLRREWFGRFLGAPSRLEPGVEMPAITLGIPGILDGDREAQVAALWHALNSAAFAVPASARVEQQLTVPPGDPPRVIRDVFRRRRGKPASRDPRDEAAGWTPRALAIGLPGGWNFLYDLDVLAPVACWTDAFARQRTQGKSWYWETAGIDVLDPIPPFPPLALREAGRWVAPIQSGRSFGRLSGWSEERDAVELRYHLRFPKDRRLAVRERVSLREGSPLRVVEVVSDAEVELHFLLTLPRDAAPRVGDRGIRADSVRGPLEFVARGGSGRWEALDGAAREALKVPGEARVFAMAVRFAAGRARLEVALEAPQTTPSPHLEATVPSPERWTAEPVSVLPGFHGLRLPLERKIMPTSFAFAESGAVFVASLSGEIALLRDTDGDGVEDTARRLAAHLSAPFGMLAEGDKLLVSHKPELLELSDTNGDGYHDRVRVVATGWGLTHDYHDWSFGLVKKGGDYYVLLASDYAQAGRPVEASAYRGHALRISPSGALETVARGMRYPAGLARNSRGELFFTDNQGDGNPFNEINHLSRGGFYGLPGLHDPPFDRERRGELPAVQIPHPWTRSVNGICFLDAAGKFGPLEGHGVGCEYDNRKLIRFTLEEVDGVYQGATYPFSRPTPAGGGLLGPIGCAVSPRGELYVGNIHDSGWGGGDNVGTVVRFRMEGELPPGILEARARPDGFELEFTRPCDPDRATDPESYSVSAYRRIWKGGYATPDRERHRPEVTPRGISEDRRRVRLEVRPLRAGFLYEIHCRPLGPGGEEAWWPATAYYSLKVIPSTR
ncbi:MAG: c-type cytochrome [Planctomycetota bacterium]|nr:c-type cytochrome [Planctomycetota bacterium]